MEGQADYLAQPGNYFRKIEMESLGVAVRGHQLIDGLLFTAHRSSLSEIFA